MAFDRSDPTQLQELTNEITLDPMGMGYSYDPQTSSTTQILKLLNDPVNNVGGETVGSLNVKQFLLDILDPNDLTVGGQFSQGDLEFVKMVIESSAFIEEDISEFIPKLTTTFTNGATQTGLQSAVRVLSRAEVLWGEGTTITRNDILAAV